MFILYVLHVNLLDAYAEMLRNPLAILFALSLLLDQ